jgi:hypothetical protein
MTRSISRSSGFSTTSSVAEEPSGPVEGWELPKEPTPRSTRIKIHASVRLTHRSAAAAGRASARWGSVTEAARAAGVAQRTAYRWPPAIVGARSPLGTAARPPRRIPQDPSPSRGADRGAERLRMTAAEVARCLAMPLDRLCRPTGSGSGGESASSRPNPRIARNAGDPVELTRQAARPHLGQGPGSRVTGHRKSQHHRR